MNGRLGEWGDHITLQAAADRVSFHFVSTFTALVLKLLIVQMYLNNDLSFVLVSPALLLLMPFFLASLLFFFFLNTKLVFFMFFISYGCYIGNPLTHPRKGIKVTA